MGDEDSRKIFVGRTGEADEGTLEEYFKQFGAIESVKIEYTDTNKPRGFGFVVFTDESTVAKVTDKESHTLPNGTVVSVSKSEKPQGGGGRGGRYGGS